MMTNGDPEGRIFLSYPHTNNEINLCLKLPTDLKQYTYNTSIIPLTTHVSLIFKIFD